MRALKTLVIVLGVLIAAGLVAVVVAVIGRVSGDGPILAGSGEQGRAAFGDVKIDLPAGARVLRWDVAGDRLIVHLSSSGDDFAGPSGAGPRGTRVLVIDLGTGKKLGSIVLAPE